MPKRRKATQVELALATKLFRAAQAEGGLKPPPGLIAVTTGTGYSCSLSVRETQPVHYLPEARKVLRAQRKRS